MFRTLLTLLVVFALLPFGANAHSGGRDKNGCHRDSETGERHCHKKRASVCAGKVPIPGEDEVLNGRVVGVTDGDTFKAKIQGVVMTFRMSDIDAPEKKQPYGPEAQAALKAALGGKDVVMLIVDQDSYGRFVVHVWIGKLHINRELVDRGHAWFYPEYAPDNCLQFVEEDARDAKRGLWKLPLEQRMEPWNWRKEQR